MAKSFKETLNNRLKYENFRVEYEAIEIAQDDISKIENGFANPSIKTIFKNNVKSYLIITFYGIVAGLLVAFFSDLPADGIWSFSYFGSSTLGFWMFSTSVIVLLSEKRLTASINAGVYVFLMFYITGIYKEIRNYSSNIINYENTSEFLLLHGYSDFTEYIFTTLISSFVYGIIPAIICSLLAAVLWNGRKQNIFGKILIVLPVAFIVLEAVTFFISVFANHTMLFMALVDTLCVLAYILLFKDCFLART